MYIYLHKFSSKCHNVIVRLPHPWSGDKQGQVTFVAPSADNQD